MPEQQEGPAGQSGPSAAARGALYAAGAGLAFSFYGLLFRLLGEAGVWHIIFYRTFGIIPLCALALYLVYGSGLWRVMASNWRSGILVAVPLAAAQILINQAFAATTVASVLFVTALVPFGTALGAWLLLRDRIEKRTVWGMLVALIGIVFVAGSGIVAGKLSGVLLAFAAMTAIVAFNLVLRANRDSEMLPAVAYSSIMTGCVASVMLWTGGIGFAVPPFDFAIIQLMGAGSLGLGLVLFTLATRLRPVAELSLLTQLEIVLTPLWVWLGVGEVPSTTTLIGGSLILIALLIAVAPQIGRGQTGIAVRR